MNVRDQIKRYIASHPEPKRSEMVELDRLIRRALPRTKLWFNDGKNADGKVVSNPNIGYGSHTMTYADGTSREFYRIGLSANTAGISVYVLGLADKSHLAKTYGKKLGKATVTGYCIKFRKLADIDAKVLAAAVADRGRARA